MDWTHFTTYNSNIDIAPNNHELYQQRIKLRWDDFVAAYEQGDKDNTVKEQIRADALKIQALSPGYDIAERVLSQIHLTDGNQALKNGDIQGAIAHYDKAEKLIKNGNSGLSLDKIYLHRAEAYEKLGDDSYEGSIDYHTAIQDLNRAIRQGSQENRSYFIQVRDRLQTKLDQALGIK